MSCDVAKQTEHYHSSNKLSDKANKKPVSALLWMPFSLKFDDAALEQEFRNENLSSRVMLDVLGNKLGMLLAPIFFFSWGALLPKWHLMYWLGISFVLAPAYVFYIKQYREIYIKYHTESIFFSRLLINTASTLFGLSVPLPDERVLALLSTLLTKSPMLSLLFSPFIHRIEFRHYFFVQSLLFCESLAWILPFCEMCSNHPPLTLKFDQMGRSVDWIFGMLINGQLDVSLHYPCWMISGSMMTIVGWVLPILLTFLLEVTERSAFLIYRVDRADQDVVYKYTREAFQVGFFGFLSASLCVWFLFSLFRNCVVSQSHNP